MGRDIELFGQNLPVACGLVEHEDEVRIFKNIRYLVGSQQILDVLRNTCRRATPLAETLPDLHRIGRGLFLTKQEMEFVYKESGRFSGVTVRSYTAPDGIRKRWNSSIKNRVVFPA